MTGRRYHRVLSIKSIATSVATADCRSVCKKIWIKTVSSIKNIVQNSLVNILKSVFSVEKYVWEEGYVWCDWYCVFQWHRFFKIYFLIIILIDKSHEKLAATFAKWTQWFIVSAFFIWIFKLLVKNCETLYKINVLITEKMKK